jgi:hypothetical protein
LYQRHRQLESVDIQATKTTSVGGTFFENLDGSGLKKGGDVGPVKNEIGV